MDIYSFRADLLNDKGQPVRWRIIAENEEKAREQIAYRRRELAFFRGYFGTLLSVKQIGGAR